MTEKKPTDKAAQQRKASADQQAQETGPLGIRDDVEDTPTASEIIADDQNKVFGDNPERQFQNELLTSDQQAVAKGDEPVHKPAENAPDVGARVILTTASPIGGQTDNPAIVIGYAPNSGNPNLRLENLDGGRGRPLEFGNVPYGEASEERGPFYRLPEDFAAKEKSDSK
jgi:hypothetical protein